MEPPNSGVEGSLVGVALTVVVFTALTGGCTRGADAEVAWAADDNSVVTTIL